MRVPDRVDKNANGKANWNVSNRSEAWESLTNKRRAGRTITMNRFVRESRRRGKLRGSSSSHFHGITQECISSGCGKFDTQTSFVGTNFISSRDTVSSVGLVRGDVFLSTSSSAAHACHFRHALALDELRVKFMPEYFNEMNSQTNDVRSKYIVNSDEHVVSPTSERRESTVSDSGTDLSGGKNSKNSEIKEVWFAGSHSDV